VLPIPIIQASIQLHLDEAFKNELSTYKNAKRSVQFPFDQPLPLVHIKTIVAFRAREDIEKAVVKSCFVSVKTDIVITKAAIVWCTLYVKKTKT